MLDRSGTPLRRSQDRRESLRITVERPTRKAPREHPDRLRVEPQPMRRPPRNRRQTRNRLAPGKSHNRIKIALVLLTLMLVAAVVRLSFVQGWNATQYADQAVDQRTRTVTLNAERGSILDRNGTPLAFTVAGKALAARPAFLPTPELRAQVITALSQSLGSMFDPVDAAAQLDSGKKYVYLARGLMPAQAEVAMNSLLALAMSAQAGSIVAQPSLVTDDLNSLNLMLNVFVHELGSRVDKAAMLAALQSDQPSVVLASGLTDAESADILQQVLPMVANTFDSVISEDQPVRQYPEGVSASDVVGTTSTWDSAGQSGIESRFNATLAGMAGSKVVDVYGGGVIPGSARDQVLPVNGSDVTLTLDFDLQFAVNQMLASYVDGVGAKRGMALVEDVKTGQIYAISTYQPVPDATTGNLNIAVGSPFEPGSVNKVVTMSAALDAGLVTPTSTFMVDGSIQMGGRTIHDAWGHGTIEMTTTGILAKSSNVGTLTIAQLLGPDAFAAQLAKFGLGQKTGIELGGETEGVVPDQAQWSNTTFANLPIGQGLSMTLVQMASMYQTIGNGGVRLAPTLLMGTTTDGSFAPNPTQPGITVMQPSTAWTLLGMLRATTQDGDIGHRGTAPGAQITGYQTAGKTGTAQQVDPSCGCYSDTLYNSTFAGLVPADNPRFVVAIMLDAPQNKKNAVPLFHDIAAFAMRAFDVPPSTEPAPVYDLYVNYQ